MLFKSLTWFNLGATWLPTPGALEGLLQMFPLRPCEGITARTTGWVAPWPDGALVRSQGLQYLVTLGWEEKVLPGAVIKKHVKERATAIEREKGYAPGRKMLKELKELVILELLPKAFVKPGQMNVWLDLERRRIVIASSSTSRAEDLVEYLRACLGELAVTLQETPQAPASIFTAWVAAREAPGRFQLGDACSIQGRDEEGTRISYGNYSLESDDIRQHLKEGRAVTRLALTWDERVSFIITERLQLRRIDFLAVRPEAESQSENAEENFDGDFVLMAGELGQMLDDLVKAMGASTQ